MREISKTDFLVVWALKLTQMVESSQVNLRKEISMVKVSLYKMVLLKLVSGKKA